MRVFTTPSFREKSPKQFQYTIVGKYTIIQTVTPGVYWIINEVYTHGVPASNVDNAEWAEVIRIFHNHVKLPAPGRYITLKPSDLFHLRDAGALLLLAGL